MTTRYRLHDGWVDDALQVTRRLVEEVATSNDDGEGIEPSFHDIEKPQASVKTKFRSEGLLWQFSLKTTILPFIPQNQRCLSLTFEDF